MRVLKNLDHTITVKAGGRLASWKAGDKCICPFSDLSNLTRRKRIKDLHCNIPHRHNVLRKGVAEEFKNTRIAIQARLAALTLRNASRRVCPLEQVCGPYLT